MAEAPDFLSLRRHREQAGAREVPIRRAGVALVGIFCVAGLLNVFGQRPGTSLASGPGATLKLYAASHLRSGLYYEARITIDAQRDLENAVLVLNSGWVEGTTVNTIEPGPLGEASRNGNLELRLGHVPAGKSYILFMQLQVNPTNVGRRSQDVALYDGGRLITSIDRTVTIFP